MSSITPKQRRQARTISLPAALWETIDKAATGSGHNRSRFVEAAVREYLSSIQDEMAEEHL
jgi:metal-responsive CopG/Arc/MetJ family transcriptional regulator